MPTSIATSDPNALRPVPPSTGTPPQRASRTTRGLGLTHRARRLIVGLVAGVIGITATGAVTMAQELTLPAVTGTAAVGRTELALDRRRTARPLRH